MNHKENETQSFWTTLPGILTGCASVITAIAGLIVAFNQSGIFAGAAPTSTPTAVIMIVIETPSFVSSTNITDLLPTPNLTTTTDLSTLPTEYGCPYDVRAGWLQYMDNWYGPWNGYSIQYNASYFYVYDLNAWNAQNGTYGLLTAYTTQFAQNVWTSLSASPFWVCVDTSGNVYTVYAQ